MQEPSSSCARVSVVRRKNDVVHPTLTAGTIIFAQVPAHHRKFFCFITPFSHACIFVIERGLCLSVSTCLHAVQVEDEALQAYARRRDAERSKRGDQHAKSI